MNIEYYTREEFLNKLREGMAKDFKFGCAAQKGISGSAAVVFSTAKIEVTWKDIPLALAGPLKPGMNNVRITCPHCGTQFGANVGVARFQVNDHPAVVERSGWMSALWRKKPRGPFLVENNPNAESNYVDFIIHVGGTRNEGAVFALKEFSVPVGRPELWHTISYGKMTGYHYISLSYTGSPKRSGFLKFDSIR